MAAVDVPSRHKALIYDEPGKISTKIEEIETPKPGVGEVLVHLTHSGVCHSDMGVMSNSWAWLVSTLIIIVSIHVDRLPASTNPEGASRRP